MRTAPLRRNEHARRSYVPRFHSRQQRPRASHALAHQKNSRVAVLIAKISKGTYFAGLAHYLTKDGRGKLLDLRNLASGTPDEAAGEMQIAASVSTRTSRPVMHISISYNPEDTPPSDADMRSDAAEVLDELGLADNQAVVIKHDDRAYRHFHIMVNRVGPDGKAVRDSQSYPRIEAALRRIELRRGLTITDGRHAPANGKRMTGHRSSPDPRQHSAPERVRQTLIAAKTWRGLHRELARDGWRLETVQKGKRSPGAVLVGPGGQRIAAGKIDREATLSKLRFRLDTSKHSNAGAQVSDGANGRPLALVKPPGTHIGRKKQKPEERLKVVVGVGAEVAAELIGSVAKDTAIRGGLIGAGRKLGARKAKRRNLPRFGM
ncbi:relaxase/mobilization nuclease domain-containing protein [Leisingera sp. McT4-56]|nr:relaxase/mobilization nuclease domain-containing protein [Leisingera sp. McT4-56]